MLNRFVSSVVQAVKTETSVQTLPTSLALILNGHVIFWLRGIHFFFFLQRQIAAVFLSLCCHLDIFSESDILLTFSKLQDVTDFDFRFSAGWHQIRH